MESASIAANGFRFRVPYGTLLCVSDKPLHGEIKLPGMQAVNGGLVGAAGQFMRRLHKMPVVGARQGRTAGRKDDVVAVAPEAGQPLASFVPFGTAQGLEPGAFYAHL